MKRLISAFLLALVTGFMFAGDLRVVLTPADINSGIDTAGCLNHIDRFRAIAKEKRTRKNMTASARWLKHDCGSRFTDSEPHELGLGYMEVATAAALAMGGGNMNLVMQHERLSVKHFSKCSAMHGSLYQYCAEALSSESAFIRTMDAASR